jgi:hypothetical protein
MLQNTSATTRDTSGASSQTLPPGLSPRSAPLRPDADWQLVNDNWDDLPPDVRRMIAGVVRATVEAGKVRK